MRLIKKATLEKFFLEHPEGKKPLLRWYDIIRKARWGSFDDMRTTFPSADEVTTQSGKKAVIFNIKKNDFRLITVVHYEKIVKDQHGKVKQIEGKVYLFFFLTHAQYDKESWKAQL